MTPKPDAAAPPGSPERTAPTDLLDRLPVATLRVGDDGRVWRLNPAAAAILGRAEAIEGTTIGLLLPGLTLNARSTTERWCGQIPSPEPRWVEVVASRAPAPAGSGAQRDWIVCLHDVTEWVAREETRDEILSLIAHDLRTPLATLRGFSENLADSIEGPVNDRQRAILERMIRTARRANRLLEGLLEGARCRAGRDTLHVAAVSVERLVREAADAMRATAAEKSLTIATDVETGLAEIESDSDKLEQVLTNLVANSIKYTPRSGSITIRASKPEEGVLAVVSRLGGETKPASRDLVQITVEDTGIGIPSEDIERIFERYSRTRAASAPGLSSYGLGLWICRDIVTRLGGRIVIQSEVGKGTRVSVLVPRTHAPAEAPTPAGLTRTAPAGSRAEAGASGR